MMFNSQEFSLSHTHKHLDGSDQRREQSTSIIQHSEQIEVNEDCQTISIDSRLFLI